MATITSEDGHTTGTSDDGRIVYQYNSADNVRIDGRWAWRGDYLNPETGIADGGAVDPADWSAACALIREVIAVREARLDALRKAVHAAQDARDVAGARREEWLRKNTRGTYMDDGTY